MDQKLNVSFKGSSMNNKVDVSTIDEGSRLGYITRVKVKGLDKKGREVWF